MIIQSYDVMVANYDNMGTLIIKKLIKYILSPHIFPKKGKEKNSACLNFGTQVIINMVIVSLL